MDIEQVKAANPIEKVIDEDIGLRKAGRYYRGKEHDSLIVDPAKQAFFWNSQGWSGDVITWIEKRQKLDFKGAVLWLCDRAKIEAPRWGEESTKQRVAARARYDALTVASRHFVRCLRQNDAALAYCRSRGWTDEAVQEAGLGYVDGNRQDLIGELSMHGIKERDPAAKAVLGIPTGMLVYPHVVGGRVVYISARMASHEQKRHYNLKSELVGERQPYYNHQYTPMSDLVVVVEGQADAITLGMWGFAAIAMAGCAPTSDLLKRLCQHKTIVLGLDQDGAGQRWTSTVANALGPMTRLVCWPEHDANDWCQNGATAEDAKALIAEAQPWVLRLAHDAGQIEGLERESKIKACMIQVARMNDLDVAMWREQIADDLGIGLRQFNALLKAAHGECEDDNLESEEEDGPTLALPIPGGFVADHLIEMIVEPPPAEKANGDSWSLSRGRARFAVRYPNGQLRVVDSLEIEGIEYMPLSPANPLIAERVVHFPSALGKAHDLRQLVTETQSCIHFYVDLDPFYETLASYYVIFTWLYDSFNTVPYLRFLGDAGTGKSRMIQVIGALCYRPFFLNGSSSISPMFRTQDKFRGTMVVDEADISNSDESNALVKILNTGYQRTQGFVLRSGDKQSGFETELFVTYSPKVIATRRQFQDWAVESRCLTYETGGPTTRDDIPRDLPRAFWTQEAPAIRNKLLTYRMTYWKPEIELDYSRMDESVEPRLNQVTVALQTLIDDEDLGEDLRQFIRAYNRQLIVERGMTLTARVLEAMVGLGELARQEDPAHAPVLPIKSIATATNVLIDWENQEGDFDDDDDDDRRRDDRHRVKSRKVGSIVRKQLHLRSERSGAHNGAFVAVWDQTRIDALAQRFGVDDTRQQRIVDVLEQGKLDMTRASGQVPF